MSSAQRMYSRMTLYFGPPKGMYDPEAFGDFVQTRVSARLESVGRASKCNPERTDSQDTIYHFPDSGVGFDYKLISPNRCRVDLLGTKRASAIVNDLISFVFDEDNAL